ncbi:hypothetical protein [Pseudonocardia phyllosphaerae]|uniref:hypothetical protein n=1 Tax=Pseudonocardia phyllosphaerae TaxID=3390502 RepID=UPI0039781170
MTIQSESGTATGGGPAGPRWDEVFAPSDLGLGVFDVRWDLRPRLRRWLTTQDLPTASGRETHRPAIDAWALLDGGVIAVSAITLPGSPPGAVPMPGLGEPAPADDPSLPPPPRSSGPPVSAALSPGMRVVGFRTLRLLISRLGIPGPPTAIPGEYRDVPGVVERLYDTRVTDAEMIEQAELLATGTDRSSLRWVVAALRP